MLNAKPEEILKEEGDQKSTVAEVDEVDERNIFKRNNFSIPPLDFHQNRLELIAKESAVVIVVGHLFTISLIPSFQSCTVPLLKYTYSVVSAGLKGV